MDWYHWEWHDTTEIQGRIQQEKVRFERPKFLASNQEEYHGISICFYSVHIMVNKGNHPQMALFQVSEKFLIDPDYTNKL